MNLFESFFLSSSQELRSACCFLVSLKDWRYVENGEIREIRVYTLENEEVRQKDFAMIKLRVPIEFTNTVRPICLPSLDQTAEVILNSLF